MPRTLTLPIAVVFLLAARVDLLAQGSSCPGGVCRPPAGAAAAHPSVVRIVNQQGAVRSMGSGTLVDANAELGLVLSCAHLFREGTGEVTVTFPSRQSYGAKVLAVDASADLSALLIERPSETPVSLAAANPRIGERLSACGYGPDGWFASQTGPLVRYVSVAGAASGETLEMSGRARQGDSGGPILNARRELAGVLFGTGGGLIDGTCVARVRRFLGRLSPRWREPKNAGTSPEGAAPLAPAQPEPAAPGLEKLAGRLQELHVLVRTIASRLEKQERALGPAALERHAPDAIAWLWPVLFGALGLSAPPTAVFLALRLGIGLLRWKRRRRDRRAAANSAAVASQAQPASVHSLNDDYACQLQSVFELSGRSPEQDATLGRDYDEELTRAAASSDP